MNDAAQAKAVWFILALISRIGKTKSYFNSNFLNFSGKFLSFSTKISYVLPSKIPFYLSFGFKYLLLCGVKILA